MPHLASESEAAICESVDETRTQAETIRKRTAAWRGFKGTCPRCGEAKLFRAYLKPVKACASCGAPWEEVRADDGPAWATMLVVGHVLGIFFHTLAFRYDFGFLATTLTLMVVALVGSLLLLPRMKGLFIGWIWKTGALTS